MATKTKIKWRLSNLPEPSEVTELLKAGILTKDEAREILISLETEDERDKKSLQEEIKFLRELVAKLTTNRSVIVESIQYIEKPYRQRDWYQPYIAYYGTAGGTSATNALYTATSGSTNMLALKASSTAQQLLGKASDFTAIKTF